MSHVRYSKLWQLYRCGDCVSVDSGRGYVGDFECDGASWRRCRHGLLGTLAGDAVWMLGAALGFGGGDADESFAVSGVAVVWCGVFAVDGLGFAAFVEIGGG